MQISCGKTLKNARIKKKMKVPKAARDMNISARKLYQYESGKFKIPDPQVFADGTIIYNDIKVALSYLNENPVFKLIFGVIELTDPLTALVKYATENDGGSQTNRDSQCELSDGNEPLLDRLVRKARNSMDSAINFYLNIWQKSRFAY